MKYGLNWEFELTNPSSYKQTAIENKHILQGSDMNHRLIEGDNMQSLQWLLDNNETFELIYIDPPYNTGKNFRYKDKFYDKNSNDIHSQWLNFMFPRLNLAKNLLSEDGVIFISIGEQEYAQLKLLCDMTFGEENYLSNIIWDKRNPKGDAKTISSRKEYILVYCKNKNKVGSMKIRKDNAKTIIEKANSIWKLNKSYEEKDKLFRKWIQKQDFAPGEKMYSKLDEEGNPYRTVDLSDQSGKGPYYEVLHPITQKPCRVPKGGWRYKKENLERLIEEGEIIFGEDETTLPRKKYSLKDYMYMSLQDIISLQPTGVKDLEELDLEKDIFENPKPVNLLKKIIETSKPNARVLDFFAGSGSTGHAVLDLNRETNSNRSFTLCTSNENKICEEICYVRLERLLKGYTNQKGTEFNPYLDNLIYIKME